MTRPGDAEGAVAGVATSAPGDLAHLGKVQVAELEAVELARAGEGDVVDVEIEAHADRVGGDQEVDLAVLVQLDLGIAGARRQCPQDDGGAAALAPDQFGDGIYVLGGERDDGAARGQACQLARAGIGELRQARARGHVDAGNEPFQDRTHGLRPQQQRFVRAAPVENAIGEDVAAFQVGGELHLVDGQERGIHVERHGFHGRDPEARRARAYLFLAGDQRDVLGPGAFADAAIDLARQQAQRQRDHAAVMRQHAFDGVVGLAGVGRPQDGGDAVGALVRRQCVGGGTLERAHWRDRRFGLWRGNVPAFLEKRALENAQGVWMACGLPNVRR